MRCKDAGGSIIFPTKIINIHLVDVDNGPGNAPALMRCLAAATLIDYR